MMSQNNRNLTSSFNLIKQLEQNQQLKVQLYKMQVLVKQQEEEYFNSLTNQQMLSQKLLAEASMVVKRKITSNFKSKSCEQSQFLRDSFQRFIQDAKCLVEYFDMIRNNWNKNSRRQLSPLQNYDVLIQNCGSKFEGVEQILKTMFKKNEEQQETIKHLNSQLSEQQSILEEQQISIQQMNNQQRQLLTEMQRLNYETRQKEHSELINQEPNINYIDQINYLKKEFLFLEVQNKQLINDQRQFLMRQVSLQNKITELNQDINVVLCENSLLKQQISTYQENTNGLLETQQKIKLLQSMKKSQGLTFIKSLNPSRVTLQSKQSNRQNQFQEELIKERKKSQKKFNLQTFQKKLSQSSLLNLSSYR